MAKTNSGSYLKFAVLAVILSATFFLPFLGGLKQNRTSVSVMFIPKSESAALQMEYILANAERLPGMLSFYEKMIASGKGSLKDSYAGLDPDSRKKSWNQTLKTRRENRSSIITISVYARDKNISQLTAKQVADTLISSVSFYYNVKSELDMRIVEGPLTGAAAKNWPLAAVAGLFSGSLLAYILAITSQKFEGWIISRKTQNEKQFADFSPAFRTEEKSGGRVFEKGRYPLGAKTATAPENLPVFENSKDSAFAPEEIQAGQGEEADISAEPTDEEMKKRLNQLLKGEL